MKRIAIILIVVLLSVGLASASILTLCGKIVSTVIITEPPTGFAVTNSDFVSSNNITSNETNLTNDIQEAFP
jgi:hypothetical protein